MVIGKYLSANVDMGRMCAHNRKEDEWGEEGEKSFAFLRKSCPSSSPAQGAGRKPSELRFFARKDAPLLGAAVAA